MEALISAVRNVNMTDQIDLEADFCIKFGEIGLGESDDQELPRKLPKLSLNGNIVVSLASPACREEPMPDYNPPMTLSEGLLNHPINDDLLQILARAAVLFENQRSCRDVSTYMGKTRRTWKAAACDQELAIWEILDREEAIDNPTAFRPANEDEAWDFIKVRELIDARYFLGTQLLSIPKTPGYYADSALFDD